MEILFIGGPFDGQVQEVDDSLRTGTVIYWPPGARRGRTDDRVPGDDDVTEYVLRDGTAQYVGGLVGDSGHA